MSNVNHPPHYNSGRIEVIEAIEDWGLDYHRGNAVKYIARAGKKGGPAQFNEDLEKARWYLARAIEFNTAKVEGRAMVRLNDMNPRAVPVPALKRPCKICGIRECRADLMSTCDSCYNAPPPRIATINGGSGA